MRHKIYELFDYMTSSNKSAFVLDFDGWKTEEIEIPGFKRFLSCEGNVIKSITTSQEYKPSYEAIRRGNHLKVTYQQGEDIKETLIGDIFPKGIHIVVITWSNRLQKLAPLFTRRSEMMDWINLIREYVIIRKHSKNPVPYHWEDDMLDLARYLFENQKNKIMDQSIYDKYFL